MQPGHDTIPNHGGAPGRAEVGCHGRIHLFVEQPFNSPDMHGPTIGQGVESFTSQ